MKNKRIHSALLVMVLALTAQLSFAAPTGLTEQSLFYTTATAIRATPASTQRQQRSWRCRRRCNQEYRLCQRGVAGPNIARCRQRLRRCLRRCY